MNSIDRTTHTRSTTAHNNKAPLNNYIKLIHCTFFFLFPLLGREQEGEGAMKVRLTICFLNVSSSRLPRISTLNKQYETRRSSVTTTTTQRAGLSGLQILVGAYLIHNHSENGPGANQLPFQWVSMFFPGVKTVGA